MEIKYEFFENESLFIQKYIGNFSIEHYMKFMNFMIKTKEWKSVKKVFSDFRNINLSLALENLDKLTIYRDETIKTEYFNVFLVDNPDNTVAANLYQENLNKYDYNYCSTIGYAINVLGLNKSEIELERIIKDLKNQF